MMTHLGEMEEELDEGVVADHLRGHELNNFRDHGYLQFANFDKTEHNWINSLSQQRTSVDESSPQARSHLSPEPASVSDLASPLAGSGFITNHASTDVECSVSMDPNFTPSMPPFDYSQRLPSLEGSSSVPIGRSVSGLSSQSWQPFGVTSAHTYSQASSLQGPGGHLFPVFSGSISLYGNDFGPPTNNNNATNTNGTSNSTPITIPCGLIDSHAKPDSQFVQTGSYTNHVTAAAAALAGVGNAGVRMRSSLGSSPGPELQPIRLDSLGLSVTGNNAASTTPIPSYPPSAGSSNSQSSTPAHQTFGYGSNGSSVSQLNSSQTNLAGGQFFEENTKAVTIKQRSKKESHNRIERKRRDYINSQIVYLSSLLPPELYRDVDGRRNKGSVLRLSVNYIVELREAVSRMNGLKQENALARQLIPLLLKRIEALEQGAELHSGSGTTGSPPTDSPHSTGSFESLYQSWLMINESNQRAHIGSSGNLVAAARAAGHNRHAQQQHQPQPQQQTGGTEQPYFPELMMHTTDAESEIESAAVTSVSGNGGRIRVSGPTASQPRAMINVKREQAEEENQQQHLAESAPSRMRMDTRRLSGVNRPSFTELSNPERIVEEVAPLDNGSYENQSNSAAYERYQRILQQARQPSLFGHNE